MLWPIYEWLGPLFTPCTGDSGIVFTFEAPVHLSDALGNTLFDSGEIAYFQTVTFCPTPMMDVLVLLALFGVAACVFSLVAQLIEELRKAMRRPDPTLERFVESLDRVSDEYLKKV